MRLHFLGWLALAGGLVAGMAAAQTREDMERCRAILDDSRRLACYDAISIDTGGPLSKYETVSLEDLLSYALSYRGQLVEVSGWIEPGRDFLFMSTEEGASRSLPIDDRNIGRRDRQAFLDQCGKGCAATVQGRVRPVNFTTGIVADTLIAR